MPATVNNLSEKQKQQCVDAEDTAATKFPLILVCGPWGSGTSAVTGMLAKIGLWAPGPYLRLKDVRTENTFEMLAFRELLMKFVNEKSLLRQMDSDDIVKMLIEFRGNILKESQATTGAGKPIPLLLKHPLAALLLPEIQKVFDLRIVGVLRTLEDIEKTRSRRNWHPMAGKQGGEKIYTELFNHIVHNDVPFAVIRYSDVVKNPETALNQLANFCNLDLTQDAKESALAYVRTNKNEDKPSIIMANAKKYNICIVRPWDNPHAGPFLELAQLLSYTLNDMGIPASIEYNDIKKDCRNIIIGCHLFTPQVIKKIPADSIIINTEQLYANNFDHRSGWSDAIVDWAKHFEIWDYSEKNLPIYEQKGVKGVKFLKIGYHPKLTRIPAAKNQDIDVLFYGSLNDRRRSIIDSLKSLGIKVCHVFGVFGQERDELISRAKVVLNMHYYDTQIFEIVRAFYLMANQKAIVSEVNKTTSIDASLRAGVFSAAYDNLVGACMEILENPELRERQERLGFETISKISQREILAAMLVMPDS